MAALVAGCASSSRLADVPEPTLLLQLHAPGEETSLMIVPRE